MPERTLESELLTVDDLARLLRTTRPAVYAMRRRGVLPGSVKVGRQYLWRPAVIESWLIDHESNGQ